MTYAQFNLDLNLLKFINTASSCEEGRHYLGGVFVEARKGHVFLTATNGHILLSSRVEVETCVEEGESVNFIIPRTQINQLKIKKSSTIKISYSEITSLIEIFSSEGTLALKPVEGPFPDWRRAVPAKPEDGCLGVYANFNWEYLADIQKAAKLICDSKKPQIAVGGYSPWSAHYITIPTKLNVFGLIMPLVNLDCTVLDRPSWLEERVS